ncbi:3-isopropylmalate dehydratase small subunit [Candidatus Karelsulcia muelleri]|uniref:3-isopropylmalate dehydratase small subunit n=1 Tax=Candidatus Karelsulcia muelleri PSPU TaxID=1189303 RepID=A0AAD1AZV4_9FLAO|nr:3-isopropylmalate dehydratase small subunit [Candidatus Karelsulcia muelleri]NJJ98864.1 3-isopropylmalate dehydratase small subunit [Candidatus Karelsulcia muelleri]BAO66227.1 3-isopropylmalate dehydratase small subunit [Candidatus Karelsulcia muelleri PSPU]
MEKFITLFSTAVPLDLENIDTDQIIPARFLKLTTKSDFGKNLFRDWRYNSNGKINKNFILNNKNYSGKILITGKNFGCGSSREHAAWAIKDYGFKVVISNFFADIFKQNALNNGLLTIELKKTFLNLILKKLYLNNNLIFEINIENQYVKIENNKESFKIDDYKKKCFINGYDDIEFLLSFKKKIKFFEKKNFYN